MAFLALVPATVVAVLFSALEVVRRSLFADVDAAQQLRVHLVLDFVGMYATTAVAAFLVARDRARAEAERARDRDRQEEERVRTASLAATGELAAAVAHEVKNPLQGILGAVDVLARGFPAGDRRAEMAHEVIRQIRRLDQIVRDLLEFARPQVPRKVALPLRPLVDKLFAVSGREQAGEAPVEYRNAVPEGLIAWADERMLEEALLNLVLNSRQAMEGAAAAAGGRVTVGARGGTGAPVVIEVADTGKGIPKEIRPEIFKPFFTTKHKGSGLGLTIVRKIVEAHGGRIDLESEVGRGTTFRLELPGAE